MFGRRAALAEDLEVPIRTLHRLHSDQRHIFFAVVLWVNHIDSVVLLVHPLRLSLPSEVKPVLRRLGRRRVT